MMSRFSFFSGLAVICIVASRYDLQAQTRSAEAASYVELGDKFARHEDYRRAIGAYNIALQFAPDFARAYFNRALAQQAIGDFQKAIADYSKALEIVPGAAEAY